MWDIGYNFLIGEDGNVYEGRGWDEVGDHTFGYNFASLGKYKKSYCYTISWV
jgi:N-acetylmuramoyl-L-alanine amidase